MNFDGPYLDIQAQMMCSHLDRAFEIADRPDDTAFISNFWSAPFMLSVKARRADPRFRALMAKPGYVADRKQMTTHPAVSATPEERDIAVCVALRQASVTEQQRGPGPVFRGFT
jgi:hypothetical protein